MGFNGIENHKIETLRRRGGASAATAWMSWRAMISPVLQAEVRESARVQALVNKTTDFILNKLMGAILYKEKKPCWKNY